MKELTIEQKAQRYDEAVGVCRKLYNKAKANGYTSLSEAYEQIFPALKESEDKRIKKKLIDLIYKVYINTNYITCIEHEEILAWLEKQGEKKPEVKYVYTKFRIGDVIVEIKPNGYCQPVRVKYISEGDYSCESDDGKRFLSFPIISQDEYKLIEQKPVDKVSLDFKKGDILYEQKTMSILLVYERNGSWLMTFCDYWMLKEKFHVEFPYENYGFVREMSLVHATKEQRDLLFQKMKEAGYEWDAEKKELKKIEQKPTDKVEPKFKVGDTVTVKPMSCHGKVFKGEPFKIVDIIEDNYVSDDGKAYSISLQDGWELVESEEDRKIIIELIGIFESAVDGGHVTFPYRLLKDYIRILKSCLPQNT